MSLLEAPYQIEAPPPPPPIEAQGGSNTNFTESIHKYFVQTRHLLLKITMAATATCFTGLGLFKQAYVSNML